MSDLISKISVDGKVYDLSVDMSAVNGKISELSQKMLEESNRVDGMVDQINENVATSIESLNNNLVQAINTINGGIASEVSAREEGDKALQSSIDELSEKLSEEGNNLSEIKKKVEKNSSDIATVSNNLVESINNINKAVVDGFNTINGGINNEIRPELAKAVKYEDTSSEQNPGRKTIFLNNHDNICGKTTEGSAINIAMVSKWNKVDLGSTQVELNLNGLAEHPTYNDAKKLAFLEDINGNLGTINLVKKDDLTYELQVGDRIAGVISIPADQFLKSVEYSAKDKSLTFVFNTSEGEQTSVVDLSSLVDTYIAGNGIELSGNEFSVKLDPTSESYISVSEAGIKAEGIDAIKKDVQGVSANLLVVDKKIEEDIKPELSKAVKYVDIADEHLPERKAIILKNGDVILGSDLEGGNSSLVQLNRWGVADFGSTKVKFNINTPKDVRPTVQEAGQSGEEAHKIAYLSDVESSSVEIEGLKAALDLKADKIELDKKADKEFVDKQLELKANKESVSNQFTTVNEGLDSKADKIAVDAISGKVNDISGEVEKSVKYTDLGEGRKTIQLANHDNISGLTTEGVGHNLVMLSKWNKADFGASGIELNLNGSAEHPTYNDAKKLAFLEDIETASSKHISYKELESGKKTIELSNGDSISGVNSEGIAGFNLVKVSEDNKTEVGSAGLTLNLVGAAPRPVFNSEKGIALSEDLEVKAKELQNNINLKASQSDLEAYMSATDSKLEGIKNISVDPKERHLVLSPEGNLSFNYSFKKVAPWHYQFLDKDGKQVSGIDNIDFNTEYDSLSNLVRQKAWQVHLDKANATIEALSSVVEVLKQKVDSLTKTNTQEVNVSGEAAGLTDESKDYIVSGSINSSSTIQGKSVSLNNLNLIDNARLKVSAGDIESTGMKISGDFPKKDGNAAVVLNDTEYVIFKDMVFNSSNIYNGIEIGLNGSKLPKNILFENCKFEGKWTNNAILVFGTQNNATITLSNCTFQSVSNVLRLSNRTNATGIVVNINNCKVEQWDTTAPWQGFLICEDYTSKSEQEAETNNLFGDGKITVNFVNLFHKGEKVMPSDVSSVCGSKDENQVVIVCTDAIKGSDYCLTYDKARFPEVSFK